MKKATAILCTFALILAITTTSAFASIAGSTLTATTKYLPGFTNSLVYRCDASTPDLEYMYTVEVQYLTGMNVLAGYKATGEVNGGTFSYNGAAGDAAIARWDSDENFGPGYGSLVNGESGFFTNDVAIDSSITGDVVLTYYLFGDGYGAEPHSLTNTLVLGEQEPAVGLSPATQSDGNYRSFDVNYSLDVKNLIASSNIFNLSYISNNWPVSGGTTATSSLAPLGTETINATVSIPASATAGQIETSTVIAVCASDSSISNTALLITECSSFFKGTNVYCNDFNSWPLAGWSLYELGDPAGWTNSSPGADGTGSCAFHNDDNVAAGCDDWLVTPPIDLSSAGSLGALKFNFDNKIKYPAFYDYDGVMISTGNIDPASNDYVELLEVGNTDTEWTERAIDINAYAGSNPVYFAFRYQGDFAQEWYVDNPCIVAGGEEIPGILTGMVYDASSLAPLPNAIIVMKSATEQQQITVGSNGLYEKALSTNTYDVIVSVPYYITQTQSVSIVQGAYSALNFAMVLMPVPPTASTLPAAPTTWDFAVLRGVVNPNMTPSYGYFEYGTDTNYGGISRLYILGDGTTDVDVDMTSPQLAPSTEYHYRFVAYNSAGTNYGADQQVDTPVSPFANPAMWFQPPNINSGITASQSATNYPFDARIADDFMYVSSTSSIGTIRLWMSEWNGAPPYVSPYSFNIYIYTNYPGGAGCYPTNVIRSWSIPASQCSEELFDADTMTYSYLAKLSPPFIPETNMHYWISIQPAVDFNPQSGLRLSAYDVNLCTAMQVFVLAGLPDWTPLSGGDMAFAVYPLEANMTTNNYSWEDYGTILGQRGNVSNAINVTSGYDSNWPGVVTPRTGNRMLQLTENPVGGTPQAYIGWVTNLVDGDEVTASFYAWDSTDGASPSMRVYGHYTSSTNIYDYHGSAGGMTGYTTGTGEWSLATYTWTFDSSGGTRDALIIEARLYSGASGDTFWVDDEQIISPDTATVIFPIPEPAIFMLMAGLLLLLVKRK